MEIDEQLSKSASKGKKSGDSPIFKQMKLKHDEGLHSSSSSLIEKKRKAFLSNFESQKKQKLNSSQFSNLSSFFSIKKAPSSSCFPLEPITPQSTLSTPQIIEIVDSDDEFEKVSSEAVSSSKNAPSGSSNFRHSDPFEIELESENDFEKNESKIESETESENDFEPPKHKFQKFFPNKQTNSKKASSNFSFGVNDQHIPQNEEVVSDDDFEDSTPFKKFKLPHTDEIVGEPLVLSEKEPKMEVSGNINARLKDYQRDGVRFLYSLYEKNIGGILADDMGLGKTIQTIAFISALFYGINIQFFKKDRHFLPVLIVIPSSVIDQWYREFTKWTPKIRKDIYHGKKKDIVFNSCKKGRLHVVLTSYNTFRTGFEELNSIEWNCIVFDEVHKIKNKDSKLTKILKGIRTTRRFGLTGTVMQNSFEELWTLIDFIVPNYFGNLNDFREQYIRPIKNGQRYDASYSQVLKGRLCSKRLSVKINKIILRRDKSLISDELPGKEDNVVFCSLTPLQLEIYKRVLKSPEFLLLQKISNKCKCGSNFLAIDCCEKDETIHIDNKERKKLYLSSITLLTKLGNHPGLILPKNSKDPEKFERDSQVAQLAFGNQYEMIEHYVKTGQDDLICGKLGVLKTLLTIWKRKQSKVLLFSYSTHNMDLLEAFLKRESFSYHRLDGSTPISQRQKIVDNFNKSPTRFVFLISTKAGGLGLNLVSANVVVVFDPNWNVTHDLQAQDRCYRIGQTKKTSVFRLITAGTIEEVIYNRQIYKQQMANVGLHGKSESRYFTGVQGQKGQEGELFGMSNLLRLVTDTILTDEIVKRTKKAEEAFQQKVNLLESDLLDLEDHSLIFSEDQEKKLTEPSEQQSDMFLLFNNSDQYKDLGEINNIEDDSKDDVNIREILKKSGVVYSHLNTDIIGESKVEQIFAQKVANNLEFQMEDEEIPQPPSKAPRYVPLVPFDFNQPISNSAVNRNLISQKKSGHLIFSLPSMKGKNNNTNNTDGSTNVSTNNVKRNVLSNSSIPTLQRRF